MKNKIWHSVMLLLVCVMAISVPQMVRAAEASNDFVIENGVLLKYQGNDEHVVVPQGVTSIGIGAFAKNGTVTEVTIPEGVTWIKEGAFYNCTNLENVQLPSTLQKIGGEEETGAFEGCTSLTAILLPESITELGYATFLECTALKEITFPKNLVEINEATFYGCTSLTELVIPEGVQTICKDAFAFCSNITKIELPASLRTIKQGAFRGNEKVKEINWKEGIEIIEDRAFSGMVSLQSISLPASLKGVGDYVFNECYSLSEVTFADGFKLNYISEGLFSYCTSLTSITLPKTITHIGYEAFNGCSKLVSIGIPKSLKKIEDFGLPTVSKTGYVMAGWYTKGDTKISNGQSLTLKKLNTITPKWGKSRTVKLSANGGKSKKSCIKVPYGYAYGQLPSPTRAGYTFTGWYTKKSGGTKITANKKVTIKRTQTLYAHWKKTSVAKTSITGLSNPSSGTVKYSIKKQDGAYCYEICYSTSSKFTKATTKTYSSKKASNTLYDLKKGKTYYMKARVVKLDSAGKVVKGAYSTVKKIKVEK